MAQSSWQCPNCGKQITHVFQLECSNVDVAWCQKCDETWNLDQIKSERKPLVSLPMHKHPKRGKLE